MGDQITPMPQNAEGSSPTNGLDGMVTHKGQELLMEMYSKYETAKNSRTGWESQATDSLRSFRDQDISNFRSSEQSKVSLRTTKVKTRAAAAQIKEALFPNGRFPLQLKETKVPFGIPKFVHISEGGEQTAPEVADPDTSSSTGLYLPGSVGFAGDGQDLKPGATFNNLFEPQVEPEQVDDAVEKGIIKTGVGMNGEPTISPAKMAAFRMNLQIHDQLEACMAIDEMEKMIDEMCIIGTGVMKGPFNIYQEIPYWKKNEDGTRTYEPKQVLTPKLSFVSVWDLYIEPTAVTMADAEWVVERHKMTGTQVQNLKRRPLFDTAAIDRLLHDGPNYSNIENDNQTEDPKLNVAVSRTDTLYEVFEYWGYIDTDKLSRFGLAIPENAGDYVQVCAWFSGRELLRVSLNPFQPSKIPYYVTPYESDPYSIYGVGVPESMSDQQKMINGFMRMAVDNLALAGNMVFDIDESALAPGQPMEIAPGQIFRRIAGQSGQAVHGIKFPNTANENLQMVREMRQQADEATGIPSIAHGQTGVSGTGRTASGMSMILNNASLNIKSVIRNIDRNIVKPIGTSMFAWNMQYNGIAHPDIEGDLEISATGASSLEQKDQENQRLQVFLQLSLNPAIAPLIKLPTIIKKLALTMDMEPEEILNTPDEAAFYSSLMGQQGMQQPGGGAGQVPGAPNPTPGQQGFTGNDLSAGNPEGANGGVPGVNAPQ